MDQSDQVCLPGEQARDDNTKASKRESTNWGGGEGQETGQSGKADPTEEAVFEELTADLKSKSMTKEDVDEMWREVYRREYEEKIVFFRSESILVTN